MRKITQAYPGVLSTSMCAGASSSLSSGSAACGLCWAAPSRLPFQTFVRSMCVASTSPTNGMASRRRKVSQNGARLCPC
jgi:hypothetical protein